MVTRGPFQEFMRLKVTQSVADNYEEEKFQTPASKTDKMAMLIHSITVQTSALTGFDEGDNIIVHI